MAGRVVNNAKWFMKVFVEESGIFSKHAFIVVCIVVCGVRVTLDELTVNDYVTFVSFRVN